MRNINYSFLPAGSLPCSRFVQVVDTKEAVKDDFHRLLSLVYSIDERTKLPTSDLSVLASDTVPSDIADFVRTQLLKEIQPVQSSIINGHQIDDDTLLALTRNPNEGNRAYIDRVDNYLREINKQSSEGD